MRPCGRVAEIFCNVMNKRILYSALAAALLAACAGPKKAPEVVVSVTNPLPVERVDELVSVEYAAIKDSLGLAKDDSLVILDAAGREVAWQISANRHLLLFPATVAASGTATYTFKAGMPSTFAPAVFGKHYPERVDDIAWENEYSAYRLYGPALQASGERAFGYDVWAKRVPGLVVDERYHKELDSAPVVDSLRAAGKPDEAEAYYKSVSYHVDHGNGLDCYKVGPTLGGGVAALYDNGKILYPYCYKSYKILENGPLRFTVQLSYEPTVIHGDTVTEHRIISAMKGSRLNRCMVCYAGLKKEMPVVAGLVIHPENTDTLAADVASKYIAYADLTDNVHNDNGVIYVGAVCPDMVDARPEKFSLREAKNERGGAYGHLLAFSNYKPQGQYVYYFGSSWSKYDMPNMATWKEYLAAYADRIAHPLKVKIQ